jgi:hypothetical protein
MKGARKSVVEKEVRSVLERVEVNVDNGDNERKK